MPQYDPITRTLALTLGAFLILGSCAAFIAGFWFWQAWLSAPMGLVGGFALLHAGRRGEDPTWLYDSLDDPEHDMAKPDH